MFSCIAFDVDGTLLDTRDLMITSLQSALQMEWGEQFSFESLVFAYGIPLEVAIGKLGDKEAKSVVKTFHELWEQGIHRITVFDGIVEVLEKLRLHNTKTGIVTSRRRFEIDRDAQLKSLLQSMDYSVTADDTKTHKPEAEPLLSFLKLAGEEKNNSIYIGDTYHDYLCAKNAGVSFGLACWGAVETDSIQPDYILTTPLDILKLI